MSMGLLLTAAGAAKIAAFATGGASVNINQFAVGDAGGVPYNPTTAQLVLAGEKWRGGIASVAVVNANEVTIECVLPADTNDAAGRHSHGFAVNELGIFDSTNTLIAVARMGGGYKPSPAINAQSEAVTFIAKLVVTNASAVTVTIDTASQVPVGRNVRPFWMTVDGILNAPPANPATAATYVIGAAPTGGWAGFAGRLAQWVGVWSLASVPAGHIVCDTSKAETAADRYLKFIGGVWVSALASESAEGFALLASAAETRARLLDSKAVHPKGLMALVGEGVDFRTVINASTAAPPGAPAIGDSYLIAAAATGAWATHSGKVAIWDGTAWQIEQLRLGAIIIDRATPVTSVSRHLRQVTALTWTPVAATTTDFGNARKATDPEVATGAAVNAYLSPDQIATALNRSPVFPEVVTADGRLTMAHAAAALVVTGAVLRFRGWQEIDLATLTLAQRTFATVASKTYHLRYDRVNGLRLLDLSSAGYNAGALAENNAAFDSSYDDALLARVVTSAGNVGTVTVLANKPRLNVRADISTNTPWSVTSAQRATFQGTVTLGWGRAPVMPANTVFVTWSTGPAQATMSGGHRWESLTYDRYGVAWSVSADWNDNDTSIAGGSATLLCSGSFFIGTNF